MGTRILSMKVDFITVKEAMARKKSRIGSTLTALQKAEAQVEQLRKKAASERAEHLKGLHVSFGFASRTELIDALAALTVPADGVPPAAPPPVRSPGRRERANAPGSAPK